jgi:hypothetical protein
MEKRVQGKSLALLQQFDALCKAEVAFFTARAFINVRFNN